MGIKEPCLKEKDHLPNHAKPKMPWFNNTSMHRANGYFMYAFSLNFQKFIRNFLFYAFSPVP